MKGLLLTGGDGPTRARLEPFLRGVGYTVAADSGLDLAISIGLDPDLIVGDMDSLRNPALLSQFASERVRRYPADKDKTDTEIGLELLAENGATEILVAGGGGGRLAHLMGILALFHRHPGPRTWLTTREHMELIEDSITLSGCIGQTLSFFPIGHAEIDRSAGLKWPLDGFRWGSGDVGISNVAVQDTIVVGLGGGALLMVREW